jgi:hypothetical protein
VKLLIRNLITFDFIDKQSWFTKSKPPSELGFGAFHLFEKHSIRAKIMYLQNLSVGRSVNGFVVNNDYFTISTQMHVELNAVHLHV